MTTKNSHSDNESEDPDSTDLAAGSEESVTTGKPDAKLGSASDKRNSRDSLTNEAFEKLLACFSSDRDEAARLYLKKHLKLTRFFEWNHCDEAEELADETLDRVARKIDEGTIISNLNGYINEVARIILMEWWRRPKPFPRVEENMADNIPAPEPPDPNLDDGKSARRFLCLDICLDELPPQSRKLIENYFSEDRRAKIDLRRELARNLGIGLNALRIRVHRILKVLEGCMDKCCKQHS